MRVSQSTVLPPIPMPGLQPGSCYYTHALLNLGKSRDLCVAAARTLAFSFLPFLYPELAEDRVSASEAGAESVKLVTLQPVAVAVNEKQD
jgi:hypothetical protein